MPAAPLPADEMERLAILRSYAARDQLPDALLQDTVDLAARLACAPMAKVSLVEGEVQHIIARHGFDTASLPRAASFCAHAILEGGWPLHVPDATRDPRFADNPWVLGAPGIRAYLGLPLMTPEGQALGTLAVLDRVPRRHEAATVDTLRSLARTVVTTLELRRALRRLQALALTDSLTSLANRPAMLEALSRSIARQRRDGVPFCLLYLDLDGFKALNDTAGHAAGDRALVEVGEALRATARREDVPARMGGDEFALLLLGASALGAERVGARLCATIAQRMSGRGWPVLASVGGVVFHTPPEDEGVALRAADQMMYAAKNAGGNRVAWCGHGEEGKSSPAWLRAG